MIHGGVNIVCRDHGDSGSRLPHRRDVGRGAMSREFVCSISQKSQFRRRLGLRGVLPSPELSDAAQLSAVGHIEGAANMRDWWRQAQPVFIDDASSDQTVTLLGQGSASIIVADKTQVTFGTVFTGASVTRTLTLMNRGDLGLSV